MQEYIALEETDTETTPAWFSHGRRRREGRAAEVDNDEEASDLIIRRFPSSTTSTAQPCQSQQSLSTQNSQEMQSRKRHFVQALFQFHKHLYLLRHQVPL